jgi:hypothetical protein
VKGLWALTVPCALTLATLGQNAPAPNPGRTDRPPARTEPTATQPRHDKDKERDTDKDKDKSKDRMQADQPGPEHKNLAPFIGTWQVTGTCWKDPSSQGEPVSGTCTSEWILGNRFVQSHARLNKGGTMAEGIMMCGYDNAQKKYVTTMQDSECTAIKMETGTYDAGSKTFTFAGETKDKDGKTVQCRRTVKVVDDNEHVVTMYASEGGQGEKKVAELSFRRAGGSTSR